MEWLYAVAGAALIALTLVDALWTTLWVDGGAGPVTRRTTTWWWRAVLKLGRDRHRALSVFGPTVLVATVAIWIVLLAAGWTLVFSAGDALDSTVDDDVGWTGRTWFVAYSLFTVGNGDLAPAPGAWQLVASFIGASGMALVTLAISYLLSVVSAVVRKRGLAAQVHALGSSSAELVLSGWNGEHLRSLDSRLGQLSSELAGLSQQYQSYPVLQYYHAARRSNSPIAAVAVLDDALTLMRFGVAEHARPSSPELVSARAAVQSLLDTLESALISRAPQPPAAPDLEPLRSGGVPVVNDAQFERAVARLDERRRSLLGLTRGDGWDWHG